jgi:hypothetical protein
VEKAERDAEEEWGRIPIPQSDDSDSTDEWLSQEPEQHASTDDEDQNQKGYLNCFVAFLIAPRKDGRILTKEGKIIDVNDGSASNEKQQPTTWTCEIPVATHATQPYWTKHLMAFQRQQLRKGYKKHNRSKVMMKLMRQVARYHQTGNKLKDEKESQQQSQHQSQHLHERTYYQKQTASQILPRFDAMMGFINQPNVLKQCMNSIITQTAPKHKLSPVKTSPNNMHVKKSRTSFSPIIIPGTPEERVPSSPEEHASASSTTQKWSNNDDSEGKDEELQDLDLYYKVFNNFRPEHDESNAEAAERHQAIDDNYKRLLAKKRREERDSTVSLNHELTPSKPLGSSVYFRSLTSYSSPITRYSNPIIEPMEDLPIPEPIHPTTNNVQEVSIHTDYSLYKNPDKLTQPRPIDII